MVIVNKALHVCEGEVVSRNPRGVFEVLVTRSKLVNGVLHLALHLVKKIRSMMIDPFIGEK